MQDKENVSIIIATHNNSKTIKHALESVTKSIRPPNQIIVADNDSSDNSYEILCNLLNAKPIEIEGKTGLPPRFDGEFNNIPITIFRKKLSTIGHTLNIALQMKWHNVTIFGFIDPTSWYAPDKISQAIRVFQQHPAVACVVSDCDIHHSDGRIERIFRSSFDIQRLLANYEYDRNFLVRAQIFPKLKAGFDEQMPIMDDYDFLLRVSAIGLIYHIPAPLHNNIANEINEETKYAIIKYENVARQSMIHRQSIPNG